MKTIRVHVSNENDYLDNKVDIQLPAVPRKGEYLHLPEELRQELEKQACKDLWVAANYAPKWFYAKSYGCTKPGAENLEDLSFSNAVYVSSVAYFANSELIHIEIDSESQS